MKVTVKEAKQLLEQYSLNDQIFIWIKDIEDFEGEYELSREEWATIGENIELIDDTITDCIRLLIEEK